jgi:hypothetical protein
VTAAPDGTVTADVAIRLVVAPPENTVAPESTPFTNTRIPVTSTALPALEAAVLKVIAVVAVEAEDCELALAGESIRNTEFGLIVTNVAPNVLGDEARLGE